MCIEDWKDRFLKKLQKTGYHLYFNKSHLIVELFSEQINLKTKESLFWYKPTKKELSRKTDQRKKHHLAMIKNEAYSSNSLKHQINP